MTFKPDDIFTKSKEDENNNSKQPQKNVNSVSEPSLDKPKQSKHKTKDNAQDILDNISNLSPEEFNKLKEHFIKNNKVEPNKNSNETNDILSSLVDALKNPNGSGAKTKSSVPDEFNNRKDKFIKSMQLKAEELKEVNADLYRYYEKNDALIREVDALESRKEPDLVAKKEALKKELEALKNPHPEYVPFVYHDAIAKIKGSTYSVIIGGYRYDFIKDCVTFVRRSHTHALNIKFNSKLIDLTKIQRGRLETPRGAHSINENKGKAMKDIMTSSGRIDQINFDYNKSK